MLTFIVLNLTLIIALAFYVFSKAKALEKILEQHKEQLEQHKGKNEDWKQDQKQEIQKLTERNQLQEDRAEVEAKDKNKESQPKVFRKPTLAYPVTIQQKPADDDHPLNYHEAEWRPVEVLDLRKFKESVTNFGMHSPFVKQMLTSWSIKSRVIPKDWEDMAKAILEPGPYLQWLSWWREEAREIAHKNRARGVGVSKEQLLGDGQYADTEIQAVIQGPSETFTNFSQRLTSAVDRSISDPLARKALIESLAFENANTECKEAIRPLRARSVPIDEWIRNTIDIRPHSPNLTLAPEQDRDTPPQEN
uniref:Bm11540 n=1 Tax=Brugia malayi TaxID=6279 RepID=A0A1I9G9W4_BRUMA|nr:Bm11540 [Brugia malayi]